ncbi:AT-hook motif nuclear-localized protein 4-like isoform X6 [Diospyros lotus]|uniref:AT-hook motif nuclear-localized protein 4-like isoform X4 n=1 Tax=Diospyros lotus TaxID=55363 RepID=UPI002251C0EE|nr:AT-hook motif nuclear-localized protein 4-like isoform X4 [Diospyros lotus]XP_052192741.1 AT-hook motif nuclear-localized protein 4-like isoform X5 [Diospyros lotus]XP_052192742.1 AT-hook motif nuclear-localized protein 4-like isoform X6 [Diospyros lotus]
MMSIKLLKQPNHTEPLRLGQIIQLMTFDTTPPFPPLSDSKEVWRSTNHGLLVCVELHQWSNHFEPPRFGQIQRLVTLDNTPFVLPFSNSEEVCRSASHGSLISFDKPLSRFPSFKYTLSSSRDPPYQGMFDIVSLSGLFAPSEVGTSAFNSSGCLKVVLARPGGHVFGGALAGRIIADIPVQLSAEWASGELCGNRNHIEQSGGRNRSRLAFAR